MKPVLRLLILIFQLTGLVIGISWVLFGLAIGFGAFPKLPQPVTQHTIPYSSHGTTYYLTSFQDGFHTWAVFVSFAFILLSWLVMFIRKKIYDPNKA